MNQAIPVSRLRLRALHPADQALFCALYGDAETMKFIGAPLDRRIAVGRFATLIDASDVMDRRFFAITQANPRETVGFCGIQPPDQRMGGAEIGIVLDARARGRGYGTAVLKPLIEMAFAILPIDCVWVQYRATNTAAGRLFARAGFKPADMRPYRVRQTQQIRVLERAAVRLRSSHPEGEAKVSNIIRFIESVGRDAALRHLSEGQLEAAMRRDHIAPSVRAAILARDSASLETLLDVRETLYCVLMTPEPKKAPTKKPVKKPKKAPPKKPAKKPAKPAKKPAKKK